VAAVKTQVGINFLKTPTNFMVSNFFLGAAGQRGFMSTKLNPLSRNVDRHTLRSNCNVGLCRVDPLPQNASRSSKAVGEIANLHVC